MSMLRLIGPLTALILPLCAAVSAEDVVFSTRPRQVTLIELYTSEGCSSCPPAERWLGGLRDSAGLWRDFVPIAFHVNYWDHLGWRDALASKAFTERQYAYSTAWRASSVYTPCFVRNGAEWRRTGQSPAADSSVEPGRLVVWWSTVTHSGRVSFTPTKSSPRDAFDFTLAIVGSDIVSQVRRGENAGRELRHEFVALNVETRQAATEDRHTWSAAFTMPTRAGIVAPKLGLAGWVTRRGELAPLQAAGGWIPSATTSAGNSP